MQGKKCSVEGCDREAVHELSYTEAKILEEKAGLKLNPVHAKPPRRPGIVYLCEEHYKLWKKLTRHDRKVRELSIKET
jgi:hypothetical protein